MIRTKLSIGLAALMASAGANALTLKLDGYTCPLQGSVTITGDLVTAATAKGQGCPAGGGPNPEQKTLQATTSGNGSVTIAPPGISCSGSSGCVQNYDLNTVVTLTPNPGSDSTFSGWSGHADCADGQVKMDDNKNCHAAFALTNTGQCPPVPAGLTLIKEALSQASINRTMKRNQAYAFSFVTAVQGGGSVSWVPGRAKNVEELGVISRCPGDFNVKSASPACVDSGLNGGIYFSTMATTKNCRLELGQTYYLNLRNATKDKPDVDTCPEGQLCDFILNFYTW